MLVRKRIDLAKLEAELVAAGVSVPALGRSGDDLHTYDAQGVPVDLPPAAQAVVDAHVPPAVFVVPDYDDNDDADRVGGQLAQAVGNLRQYLTLASPTQAQTTAAVKLTIRLVLLLARRTITRPMEG